MSEAPQPVPPPQLFPLQNLGPFLVPPDQRSILAALKSEILAEFNCHQVGIVQAFNATNNTVSVSLVLQRAVYNNSPDGTAVVPQPTIISYPILVDVPVFMFSGGGAYIAMPVQVGDYCLVLFNDRDLDPWFSYGTAPGLPNSNRMHSLADGLALIGFRPMTQLPVNVPSDGQHIALGNSSGTLRAALDALFDALTSAVISGSAFSADTITAITNAKTAVDDILQ